MIRAGTELIALGKFLLGFIYRISCVESVQTKLLRIFLARFRFEFLLWDSHFDEAELLNDRLSFFFFFKHFILHV